MRRTKQREIILDELRKTTSHPTVDELYLKIREKIPNISIATVYRNLEMMSKEGIIQKLDLSGSKMRFDGNPKFHHHIRCLKCGRVEDLPAEAVKCVFNKDLLRKCGYRVLGVRIEFVGFCSVCQGNGDK